MIRIGRYLPETRAEGPGKRFAIWVQGCELHCPGCFATELQPRTGGVLVPVSGLIERIEAVKTGICGVTFLGGEPFLQASALTRIANAAHGMGLSVLCFTGYTMEWLLENGDADQKALLDAVDLLIDGPYREELRSFRRPLVGSENQRFRYLTERITPEEIQAYRNSIECRIGPDGVLQLNGMGDFTMLAERLRSAAKEVL